MDSTSRFSDRVHDYVKARPGYPPDLVRALESEAVLSPGSVVADIGSGTGISTGLFLGLGCTVFAVEPNAAMREAAVDRLGATRGFHSVNGTAETTTLEPASVDLVTAGQAFHWFDRPAARREFARILRPNGSVAMFWNDRRREGSRFLVEYEALLQTFATDYREVDHRRIDAPARAIFFGGPYGTHRFDNVQVLDYDGLVGRLLSSSYTPRPGDPRHAPMLDDLRRIFDRHERDGHVAIPYDTRLYVGRLAGAGW